MYLSNEDESPSEALMSNKLENTSTLTPWAVWAWFNHKISIG